MRRAGDVTYEIVDERAVLVSPDGSELITLNRVGTVVWELLEQEADKVELVSRLGERFPGVGRDRIEADLEAFLLEMSDLGLVVAGSST